MPAPLSSLLFFLLHSQLQANMPRLPEAKCTRRYSSTRRRRLVRSKTWRPCVCSCSIALMARASAAAAAAAARSCCVCVAAPVRLLRMFPSASSPYSAAWLPPACQRLLWTSTRQAAAANANPLSRDVSPRSELFYLNCSSSSRLPPPPLSSILKHTIFWRTCRSAALALHSRSCHVTSGAGCHAISDWKAALHRPPDCRNLTTSAPLFHLSQPPPRSPDCNPKLLFKSKP